MKGLLFDLKKYFVIYRILFKNSIMSQMEYRFNFMLGCIVQLAFMLIKATYAIVVQSVGVPINGVTPDEMLIFIGTYSALSGVFMTFYYLNFWTIPDLVRTGDLDMLIIKPISTQFLVTLQRVYIGYALVSLPIGGAMVVVGWVRAGVPVNFLHIFSYLALTICGMILAYFLFLMLSLSAFWFIGGGGMQMLGDMLWDFNNMPMIIYNEKIRIVGLFVIPIFAVTNMGPLAAIGRITPQLIIWSIISPILLFYIQRLIWKKAMRRYSSASS